MRFSHTTTTLARSSGMLTRLGGPAEPGTRYIGAMKSASLPAVPVDPALRDAVEAALEPGESVGEFIEGAVREHVRAREEARAAFLADALTGQKEARRTGVYHELDDVLRELEGMLDDARRRKTATAK